VFLERNQCATDLTTVTFARNASGDVGP
jgi:hypothetical protein